MSLIRIHRRAWLIIAAMLALFTLPLLARTVFGAVNDAKSTEAIAATKRLHLYATDGTVVLPDGKSVYIWGYSLKNEPGTATFPSPTLTVNEGESVEVTLTNIGPAKDDVKKLAHTIHFHGLDTDQANDGVPHTSQAVLPGESFTYRFVAKNAGTYFYHCHVDTVEHMQMGMHGALIVKAKDGSPEAWTGGPRFDKEYVFLLNEIDPVWHEAVEEGKPYDRTDFHPRYWTINGKAYPDTEADPDTMVTGRVGDTILIRLINSGYEPHTIHMHGEHFQVIASDGRPLPAPIEKDTILIGPAERYDILVKLSQPGSFPIHSHNITDNTNNGVYPGGMHTMMSISPALPEVVVSLKPGSSKAIVDGKSKTLSVAPVLNNNQLFVPLPFLTEVTQAVSRKETGSNEYFLQMKAHELKLTPGNKQAVYDGNLVSLPAAPYLKKGTLMVPLGAATDFMETSVKHTADQWTIRFKPLPPSPSTKEEAMNEAIAKEPDGAAREMPSNDADHSGTHTPEASPPAGAAEAGVNAVTVYISSSAYSVKELHVTPGTTVTWVNQDTMAHTVTDLDDRFDSKSIPATRSWSYTFKETDKGSHTYYCSIHPTIQAFVIVE